MSTINLKRSVAALPVTAVLLAAAAAASARIGPFGGNELAANGFKPGGHELTVTSLKADSNEVAVEGFKPADEPR